MFLKVGAEGSAHSMVRRSDTAKSIGSGDVLVYATPCLTALMEGAAWNAISPYLTREEPSVGTMIQVFHTAATPIGMAVHADAVATAIAGKKVTFEIIAFDENGEIGRAVHERLVIHSDHFLENAYKKSFNKPIEDI